MAIFGTAAIPSTDCHGSDNTTKHGNQQPTPKGYDRPTAGGRHHLAGARTRVWGVGAILILSAAVLAGCGSTTTTTTSSQSTSSSASTASSSVKSTSSAKSTTQTSGSTSYPAGKEQICQARDELKTSITALTDQSLLAAGTTAIKASVDKVQTDLDAVKTAAKQHYNAQVTDLQDALHQLQTAVGNLGNGDAGANILAVGKAITATGAAAEDLFTQLKTACDS
jgi:predicted transglutaminase-like cysteine proteinase